MEEITQEEEIKRAIEKGEERYQSLSSFAMDPFKEAESLPDISLLSWFTQGLTTTYKTTNPETRRFNFCQGFLLSFLNCKPDPLNATTIIKKANHLRNIVINDLISDPSEKITGVSLPITGSWDNQWVTFTQDLSAISFQKTGDDFIPNAIANRYKSFFRNNRSEFPFYILINKENDFGRLSSRPPGTYEEILNRIFHPANNSLLTILSLSISEWQKAQIWQSNPERRITSGHVVAIINTGKLEDKYCFHFIDANEGIFQISGDTEKAAKENMSAFLKTYWSTKGFDEVLGNTEGDLENPVPHSSGKIACEIIPCTMTPPPPPKTPSSDIPPPPPPPPLRPPPEGSAHHSPLQDGEEDV